jgi:hypothetical protein
VTASRVTWRIAAGATVLVLGLVVAVWWSTRATPGAPGAPATAPAAVATRGTESAAPADVPAGRALSAATEPAGAPVARAASSTRQDVAVEAVRDVWVRPEVDGRPSIGFTLKAGATMRWTADRYLALRVGDAGAVVASVNGSAPAPLGRDGQVLTRTFGAPPQ